MVGSSLYKVAKWLTTIWQPVLDHNSICCIKDSFDFSSFITGYSLTDKFMCSLMSVVYLPAILFLRLLIFVLIYNIVVIGPPLQILENIFIEAIKSATMSEEFTFRNIIYRQIKGVSMRSPLRPALANIFVGFHELYGPNKPIVNFRYVDNTFCLFNC